MFDGWCRRRAAPSHSQMPLKANEYIQIAIQVQLIKLFMNMVTNPSLVKFLVINACGLLMCFRKLAGKDPHIALRCRGGKDRVALATLLKE